MKKRKLIKAFAVVIILGLAYIYNNIPENSKEVYAMQNNFNKSKNLFGNMVSIPFNLIFNK